LKLSDAIPDEYQKIEKHPISYQHLTTHTSGIISGNFPDFHGPNPESPYEGLTIPVFKNLYAKTPLIVNAIPGAHWEYSNIATGLLGIILADRNNVTYETLVAEKIFKILGMNDSYFKVPDSEASRFPEGNIQGQPWSKWDLYDTAISPAGGIRSTIADMAIYAKSVLIPSSSKLESAIALSKQPLFYIEGEDKWIGMNWIIEPAKQLTWHNGSTIAFNSILAISSKHDVAVVALTDTGVFMTDENGNPVKDNSFQDIAFECLE